MIRNPEERAFPNGLERSAGGGALRLQGEGQPCLLRRATQPTKEVPISRPSSKAMREDALGMPLLELGYPGDSLPRSACAFGLTPAARGEGASCGPPPRSGRSPTPRADSFQ